MVLSKLEMIQENKTENILPTQKNNHSNKSYTIPVNKILYTINKPNLLME